MSRIVSSARPFLLYAIIICIFTCFFAPNRSFGSAGTVSDIFIARQGDVPGSSILLSWKINGASAVDIWTKTGEFDIGVTKWQLEPHFTNISNTSIPDPVVKVGDGTNRWYKIVPHGEILSKAMITSEVLGKFDIALRVGVNLLSLPVIPFNNDINSVVGDQLSGGIPRTADRIQTFKDGKWEGAFLSSSGIWKGSLVNMEADQGYRITIADPNPAKIITVVGMIASSDREIVLHQGYNFIGTAYPLPVQISKLGLKAGSGFTEGSPDTGDKIASFNGSSYDSAYLSSASHSWKSAKLTALMPGKGYFIFKRSVKPAVWKYKKPY